MGPPLFSLSTYICHFLNCVSSSSPSHLCGYRSSRTYGSHCVSSWISYLIFSGSAFYKLAQTFLWFIIKSSSPYSHSGSGSFLPTPWNFCTGSKCFSGRAACALSRSLACAAKKLFAYSGAAVGSSSSSSGSSSMFLLSSRAVWYSMPSAASCPTFSMR